MSLDEIEIMFLHPHGPAQCFRYPTVPDILIMNMTNILTAVNPTTATRRVFTLMQEEECAAKSTLMIRKNFNTTK